jgi:hypothetical protein
MLGIDSPTAKSGFEQVHVGAYPRGLKPPRTPYYVQFYS